MKKVSRKKKIWISSILTIVMTLAIPMRVFAWSPTPNYFLNASKFFENNDIFVSCLRTIGWGITCLLYNISVACENLYKTAFKFLDFSTYPGLEQFFTDYKGVVIAILCLSLVALGITFIVNHKKLGEYKFIQTFVIAIVVLTASGFIMTEINSMVMAGAEGLMEDIPSGAEAIRNNTFSLLDLDKKNGGLKNLTNENATHLSEISDNMIRTMDPCQSQNFKSDYISSSETREILKNRVELLGDTSLGDNGYTLKGIRNGFGWNSSDDDDFGNDFYYRFTFDWINIWLELGALCLVFICCAYKVFRICYEIVFGRILAYFYAADVSNEQRIVKILCGIRDNYIVLLLNIILIKVYILASGFISEAYSNTGLTKSIMILFLAFCTIDGPNLVEKITGIDAGLKSSWGKLAGAYAVGKSVGRTAKRGLVGAKNIGMAAATGKSANERAWEGSFGERIAKKGSPSGIFNKLGNNKNDGLSDEEKRKRASGNYSSQTDDNSSSVPKENSSGNTSNKEQENSLNGFKPNGDEQSAIVSKKDKMNSDLNKSNKSNLGKSGIGQSNSPDYKKRSGSNSGASNPVNKNKVDAKMNLGNPSKKDK